MASGCDPYWQTQFQRLENSIPRNLANVAIARRLLVAIWHILAKQEPYRHFDTETIAYKMLSWVWSLDEAARQGLNRLQFAKSGLLGPLQQRVIRVRDEEITELDWAAEVGHDPPPGSFYEPMVIHGRPRTY